MAAGMNRRPLWFILASALVLRGSLLAAGWRQPERFLTPDSRDYDALARSLLDDCRFSRTSDGAPELFRTPGYPLLLAGAYAVSGKSVRAAAAAQVLLDVLLCWLVYRLGRQLCSRRVGLIAAAVQAVSPAAVGACVRILSEGLFALLLTAAILLLAACLRSGRLRAALAAGALMGAACLVRPIGLFAAVIAAAVVLARLRRWRAGLAFTAMTAAMVIPWIIRNHVAAGFPGLAGVDDYNIFYYNAKALIEADPSIRLNARQRELVELPGRFGPAWPPPAIANDPQFLRDCRREGLALISAHPLAYAGLHLRTTLNVFLPAATDVLELLGATTGGKGTLAVLRRQGLLAAVRHYFGGSLWPLWLAAPMVLLTAVKFASAAAGAFAHVRWRMGAALWLMLLTLLYFVLAPGPAAHPRFRVPIAPLLSLAAGAGIAWLARRLGGRRRRGRAPRESRPLQPSP